ncbi:hypothetical protein [Acinetobacter pollinis]|uniref:hypothetical protein n=1 Tax=Acinetobacter pollinis TaxID=2605270 RepID=UPI0018C2EA4F|nr:hypothetical protein [Acinetobacter pollinis]MBF7694153.1 hypothetical protein [Acinetobacter pollinis]MBF7701735.1 hypothetical protein [Acinetobacter pollinis]
MKKIILGCVFGSFLVGCAQGPIQLPQNVRTIPMNGFPNQTQIDTVDESFKPNKEVTFDNIKLCAAQVFQNNSVSLNDTAGSFFGSYTGNYYEKNNSQTINSANLFKYIDEKNKIVIVTGNTKTKAQQAGLITDIVQYDVKLEDKSNEIKFTFQNILRAQQNTGALQNSGFSSIGTWSGARAPGVIESLNTLASKYKNCINE